MTLSKVIHFALGPLSSALISLILIPAMAWMYSVEDIGRYGLLQVIVSLLAMVMTLGLDQAYVREYHEADNRKALIIECLFPGMILLFLTAALAWYFQYIELLTTSLFEYESRSLSYLVVVCALLMYISRFLGLILRMQERGLAYSFSQLLPKLAFLLMLIIIFNFREEPDFIDLVICFSLSVALVTIILAINVRDEFKKICSLIVNLSHLKYMLGYSVPLLISNVFFWALISIDKIFIQRLSNLEEVGLYSMAANFAGAALILQLVFSTIWAPVVYRWASEGVDTGKLDKVIRYVALVVWFVWVGVGLLSPLVTYALPATYSNVQYLIMAVISHPLLYLLSEASSVGIGITRKSYMALWTSIFALIVNAAFNWLLVPIYGAAGAGSALAISFLVYFIMKTELSRYVFGGISMVKVYILVTALVSFAVYVNIVSSSGEGSSYVYLCAFFILSFLFRRDLRSLFDDLSFLIRRKYN